MKITGTEKEISLIQSLCDIALKADGIRNLQGVNLILASMEVDDGDKQATVGEGEGSGRVEADCSDS